MIVNGQEYSAEEVAARLIEFQYNQFVQPLTCVNNSNHEKLTAVIDGEDVYMVCKECDYSVQVSERLAEVAISAHNLRTKRK